MTIHILSDRGLPLSRSAGSLARSGFVQSWIEHLRQHERVTNADRVLQETILRFQIEGTPKITHLIAAESHPAETRSN